MQRQEGGEEQAGGAPGSGVHDGETFSESERDVLAQHFTNLDGPVFALVGMAPAVAGALFARYSRSPKSLRRLFLDEFWDGSGPIAERGGDSEASGRRARQLYEKVFVEFGDDSVAQLGACHLAVEQVSNLLTKELEWGRLASYLEQSTRYIAFDEPIVVAGQQVWRWRRDPLVLASDVGPAFRAGMDSMFVAYRHVLDAVRDELERWRGELGRDADGGPVSDRVWNQVARAKALDAARGLLPAATLSNLGIFASGQAYEALLVRLAASDLPEAREYGKAILTELEKVIPEFVARVARADRGVVWSAYLADCRHETGNVVRELFGDGERQDDGEGASVRLVRWDQDGEARLLEEICWPWAGRSSQAVAERVARLDERERHAIVTAYVGERTNRRHRPGRAFEIPVYQFEIVCDYGAFRDLQRHRMATIYWQPLGISLGYDVPELVVAAGSESAYREAMDRSAEVHAQLAACEQVPDACAAYAVALGYRVRFSLTLNAREAFHLIELRTGREGHPSYRRVAQQMHRAISELAGHRVIAGAMGFVDHSDPDGHRLERLEATVRRDGRSGT